MQLTMCLNEKIYMIQDYFPTFFLTQLPHMLYSQVVGECWIAKLMKNEKTLLPTITNGRGPNNRRGKKREKTSF
jgi:hypothetical protein